MSPRANQRWKTVEDRICRQLGGRRKLGNRGSAVSDGDEHVPFAVEVKAGYGQFRLSQAWLNQAKAQALRERKPWLLVQSPKNCQFPVVTLDFGVFCDLARQAGLLAPVEGGGGEAGA